MFHVEHIYKTLKQKQNKKRPLYSGLLTIYSYSTKQSYTNYTVSYTHLTLPTSNEV